MTESELQSLRASEELLRKELEGVGARFRGPGQRHCNCPFHEDRHPSAGIYFKNGAWHFYCHPCAWGGDLLDVRAKIAKRTVGEEFRSLTPQRPPERPPQLFASVERAAELFPQVMATHQYFNADGRLHCFVIRYWDAAKERKGIAQGKPSPGGFVLRHADPPHPLYNADAVEGAEGVLVVEGESCSDKGNALGVVTVTSLGGAGKARLTDWTPLAGKTVWTWADNDPQTAEHPDGAGQEHMAEVAKILAQLNPPARVFRVKHEELELPEKGDIVDFCQGFMGDANAASAVKVVLAEAMPIGIGADFQRYIDDGVAGRRRSWRMPWKMLTEVARALIPGTVTALCGDPGCGKSLAAMEITCSLAETGTAVALYELEDGRNYHLARAWAQTAGNSGLCDAAWLERHPKEAAESLAYFRTQLEEIGKAIWEPPPGDCASYEMLIDWMRARAVDGADVLIVDPVTAAKPAPKPWIADHEFMMSAKRIAEQWGIAIVLVIHPIKGHKGGGNLEAVGGGAAFTRLSHCVLWVDVHAKDKEIELEDETGLRVLEVPNRIIRVVKARNGTGRGYRIGYRFDSRTLRLMELGRERQ